MEEEGGDGKLGWWSETGKIGVVENIEEIHRKPERFHAINIIAKKNQLFYRNKEFSCIGTRFYGTWSEHTDPNKLNAHFVRKNNLQTVSNFKHDAIIEFTNNREKVRVIFPNKNAPNSPWLPRLGELLDNNNSEDEESDDDDDNFEEEERVEDSGIKFESLH